MAFDISALPFAKLMGVEITAAARDRVEGERVVAFTVAGERKFREVFGLA